MMQDSPLIGSQGQGLDLAITRLDRALGQLEARMSDALREAKASAGGLFDLDRAKLAADLDAARGREKDLQDAGAEAARALGRAIAEIKSALGEDAAGAVEEDG